MLQQCAVIVYMLIVNDEFYLGLTHAQTLSANKLLVFNSRRDTVQCESTISCSDHGRAGAA